MRIAIDARKLRDFGIGTYIRNILIELSRLDQVKPSTSSCAGPTIRIPATCSGRNFRMVPETAPTYSIAEQFKHSAVAGSRARARWCTSRTTCCRRPCAAARW